MYMQNTCSAHGPFFPRHQGDRCPLCRPHVPSKQQETEDVLAYFEHWLSQSMYEQVDELMNLFVVDKVAPATLLAVLTITSHEKHKFKHRDAFLVRCEAKLKTDLGDERAKNLLRHRR